MIDGQNMFDEPVKNNLIAYDSIHQIATGQGHDCKLVVWWTVIISKTIIRW